MSTKMREHFISDSIAENIEDAKFLAPEWARIVIEVDDGYMCFESDNAADVWEGREHL